MKRLFLTFLFLACLGSVHAQQMLSTQDTNSSSRSMQLLDKVSQKVKSYDNIVMEFEYDMKNLQTNLHQNTRGKIMLEGNKYRLDLMGTTRIFDGEKIYTIVPENEEVIISTFNGKAENTMSPAKMLTFYKDGYRYEWDITQNVHGRKIQYVKLIPKDSTSDVKWILLGIDKRTKHIYKLIKKLENGRQITIEITSFKTNQPLSKTLFSFSKEQYKDYYINRLD